MQNINTPSFNPDEFPSGSYRKERQRHYREHRHSIFFPLLLIATGIALFLNTMGIIDGTPGDIFIRFWPILFIVGGLDGIYQREHFVGPLAAIGLGTLILLGNLGYLTISPLEVIFRFWPVLFIAWGLDLIVGHRSIWSIFLAIILGLLLVASITWLAIFSPNLSASTLTKTFTQELGDIKQAHINIKPTVGKLKINNDDANNLVSAKIGLNGWETVSQNYSVDDEGGNYSLVSNGDFEQTQFNPFVSHLAAWQVNLNPKVTYTVDIKQAFGQQNIDLSHLNVKEITDELAFGRTTFIMPEKGGIDGKIEIPFGEVIILVPQGTPLLIETNNGLTASNIPSDFTRNGDVISSPNTASSEKRIDLNVDLAFGMLVVRYTP